MNYQFTQQQTWTWNGHIFTIYSADTTWNAVAGLYIFSANSLWGWSAIYVGQTDSFARRMPSHERWEEALRRGATHIHAMTVHDQWRRDAIEGELIRTFQPPLNTQLR